MQINSNSTKKEKHAHTIESTDNSLTTQPFTCNPYKHSHKFLLPIPLSSLFSYAIKNCQFNVVVDTQPLLQSCLLIKYFVTKFNLQKNWICYLNLKIYSFSVSFSFPQTPIESLQWQKNKSDEMRKKMFEQWGLYRFSMYISSLK